jgi:protein-disulfide isomerase
MKIIFTHFLFVIFAFSIFAQKPGEVLATANGQTFTVKNLSPETQKIYAELFVSIAEVRRELLSEMIAGAVFETEAKAKNQTVEKLLDDVKAKVPAPSDAEIQAVYDVNRAALGGKTLAETRQQIVAFLRHEPEQNALQNFLASLKTKYRVVPGKDVNAANLAPADILATVGARKISAREFEEKNRLALYEFEVEVYDRVRAKLENSLLTDLLEAEAKSLNVAASDLMAREITDKMREFTDEERYNLQTALKARLFAKYKAVFSLKEPAPIVQNISVDDDPGQGKANAPLTIVMFSDFQCPACASVHPILKKVVAEHAEQVRFVVRDFPLTNIHENAFSAAIAANAAKRQGKFFEYAEILYKNQNALDEASLKKYAADLGLNVKQFELDLSDAQIAAEVRKDRADGETYGIGSTPTVFVNGVKVRVMSESGFREAIEKALKK